jgi:ribosomal protein S18 acetylase RimI-like enzyme
MCVDPSVQGRGLGRMLERAVVDCVRQSGGERVILETSGRPDYERTRRFYEAIGYAVHGRIPDFYRHGDDCVIYCKLLESSPCA